MSDLHARVAAQLYAFLHAENDTGTASENATVILDMVAEALTSPEAVERALIHYVAATSYIGESDARRWFSELPDKPEHAEDVRDTRQMHTDAMLGALTAALTAVGVTTGEGSDGNEG